MWDTIRRLVAQGSTVLLTTQYLDEADQLCDRIAVIDHGKVIADGTADELKSSIGSSSLQLTLREPTRFAEARSIVAQHLGVEVQITPESGRLTAPMADSSQTPDILIRLRDNGIDVDEITVTKPSLDEVFMTITGRDENEAA